MGNAWVWKEVENHITRQKGIIFVLGAPGIGKTYTVKQICDHHHVDAFFIDSTNCATVKEFIDVVNKQLHTRIVQSLSGECKQKVVIIDELETLFQFDRGIMSAVQNLRNTTSSLPIVCLGHKILERKIQQSFPNCPIYTCSAPSETDICIWLKSYTNNTVSCDRLLQLADQCNGNLHNVIQSLTISDAPKDEQLTFEDIYSSLSKDQIRHLLQEDVWLTPLRFHENLPKDLVNRKGTQPHKTKIYRTVLESLIDWDVMMNNASQDVALDVLTQSIQIVQNIPRKKGQTDVSASGFTKLFSNLSLQKKNEKKTYSTDSGFPWTQAQIFCDYIKYR